MTETTHEHVFVNMSCCWACWELSEDKYGQFMVCGECGNKRCPKANDHDFACTASNEPGQVGSAYEHGSGAATARRWKRTLGSD